MCANQDNRYSHFIEFVKRDWKTRGEKCAPKSNMLIYPALADGDHNHSLEGLTLERYSSDNLTPVVPVMGTRRYWTIRWEDKDWVISAPRSSDSCELLCSYSWFEWRMSQERYNLRSCGRKTVTVK
jgi:hypothetical protein